MAGVAFLSGAACPRRVREFAVTATQLQRVDASAHVGLMAPGFVGRERELAALAGALANPRPALVLIEGEAGIGKTRLVREFLASPTSPAHRALVGSCPPFREPHTLGAIVDAVRRAGSEVRRQGVTGLAGALRPLFPEWATWLPPEPEPAADDTAARHRVFAALAELLDRLGTRLLVTEDAHWADEATLEFLLFLAARRPQAPSLVVTCRPEDAPGGSLLPRLSRLAAGAEGLRLTLSPLGVADTAGLVSSMLAGQPVSPAFAAYLHQRTEGVPLAVEESARLMHARGDLIRRSHGWVRRHLPELIVPPTIRDAVLERGRRLSADAQAVLDAAAVLAFPESESTLAEVAGLEASRVRAGLCEALSCGLLTEGERDGRGLASFRHALACQAVYEAIAGPRRRALHQRAGRALESCSPRPLARLVRHFREAADTGRWCRYTEQAADLALAAGDAATSAALLHDIVVHAGLPAHDQARLTRKIALPSLSGDGQLRDLARALEVVLADGSLESGEEADARFQRGRVLTFMDDWDAARAELELAVPHLAHDPATAARAMSLLGVPYGTEQPASAHLRWLRRAADVSAPVGGAMRLGLDVNRMTALLLLGEEEGWAQAARIGNDAPTANERLEITRGHMNIGDVAIIWGRYPEARRRLTKALELARAHEFSAFRDSCLVSLARLDWFTGGWHGLAMRASALAADEDLAALSRLQATLLSGQVGAATGDRVQAGQRLRVALEATRQRGAVQFVMEAAATLANLHLAEGAFAEAVAVTDELTRIVLRKRTWIWATELAPARVAALAAVGRQEEAATLVGAFACGLRGRNAPAPKAALAQCRAILAETRDQQARAAALFARAAAAWQALPRPYDALLARERQARCLLAAGQTERGLSLLAGLQQELAVLGASGDAERVERRLRNHGMKGWHGWRGGRRGYGDRLSPRELEVVRLVAAGRTNREIARDLCRSPDTVYTQLRSAMRKLGVNSRTALALRAAEAGDAANSQAENRPAGA